MTKPQSTTEWWARRRRIDRIRKIFDMFPEMTDDDARALAGCLASLIRGRALTTEQEAAYRWWSGWLKSMEAVSLATKVEHALAGLDLPTTVRNELADAQVRLLSGKDMTPRQAGLWGAHVISRRRVP